jgi:hypothetical protein
MIYIVKYIYISGYTFTSQDSGISQCPANIKEKSAARLREQLGLGNSAHPPWRHNASLR